MKILHTNLALRVFIGLHALTASISSCGLIPQTSRPDSVDIDQTEIRNQYRVGFCWSYATIGFLESKYKMDTGTSIDLSEEAIGFHRMAEELFRSAKLYQAGQISHAEAISALESPNGLQGWYVRTGSDSQRGGMELVDTYGVVPESVWSYKFKNGSDFSALQRAVLPAFDALIRQNDAVSLAKIHAALTAPGAFPSIPPTSFRWGNETITATSLARDVIKFRSSDYREVSARSDQDAAKVVAAAKRALARGLSVPLSYPADQSFIHNGVYRATAGDGFPAVNSGHAVLITDFVNAGGCEGAMSTQELRTELDKGFESLAYLKFKNSWGLNARVNEAGIPVSAGSEGYYYLDRSYIEKISTMGYFRVVVPLDIAQNPFASEPINQRVTNGT